MNLYILVQIYIFYIIYTLLYTRNCYMQARQKEEEREDDPVAALKLLLNKLNKTKKMDSKTQRG